MARVYILCFDVKYSCYPDKISAKKTVRVCLLEELSVPKLPQPHQAVARHSFSEYESRSSYIFKRPPAFMSLCVIGNVISVSMI